MGDELIDLGISTDVFALPMPPNDAVVVGGEGGKGRWSRVISRRAAHSLWYHLTVLLFPDRKNRIITRAATAPIRSNVAPTITSHVEVFRGEGGLIELLGTGGQTEWLARTDERDARRLWVALDKMLFPLGWEGSHQRSSPTPKP